MGIAANQIGWGKQVIAVYFKDEDNQQLEYLLCNPTMIKHSASLVYIEGGEGCLSVDREVLGHVPRYEQITVEAFTTDGKPILLQLQGFAAVVIQHELDHLNGVMFYDHINKKDPYKLPRVKNIRMITPNYS
ncbi:Peptide deformylase 2 [compost metagenome]